MCIRDRSYPGWIYHRMRVEPRPALDRGSSGADAVVVQAHGLDPVRHAQLGVDVIDVRLDGRQRDEQLAGHLIIALSVRHKGQDLLLATSQVSERMMELR